jgi:hypothetical protein
LTEEECQALADKMNKLAEVDLEIDEEAEEEFTEAFGKWIDGGCTRF